MASRLGNVGSAFARNPAIKAPGPKPPTVRKPGASPLLTPPVKGAGLTPAPAAALPAAPPSAAPMPWDANYESTVGGINRNRDTTLAGLEGNEQQIKQSYGFDDLSNPFSRLALLKEKFANSQRADTNSFANAGQLYSTAMDNQRADTQHTQDINYDALRRNYDADLGDITARRTAARTGAEDATTTAGWDRTQAALSNRPDAAAIPETPTATGAPTKGIAAPFTSKPGVNSKGEPGVWHTYTDGRKPVFVKKG